MTLTFLQVNARPKQDKFDKMFKIMGGHLWSNQMNFKWNANARILHNSASVLHQSFAICENITWWSTRSSCRNSSRPCCQRSWRHGVMASWSMPWRPGGQTPWPLPGAISSKHHDFKLEGTTHTAARDLVTTSKSVDLSHPRCSGFQWFPVVSNFQVFDVFDRLDTIRYLDMV